LDRVGPIDLFQTNSHGSDVSNNPILVRTIAPTVAIMNNGPRKGGQPGTVRTLKSVPSIRAFYQLHRNSLTGAEDNTGAARIANSDPAGGRFVHVTVAPDGARFTVQIDADGPSQTFESR